MPDVAGPAGVLWLWGHSWGLLISPLDSTIPALCGDAIWGLWLNGHVSDTGQGLSQPGPF